MTPAEIRAKAEEDRETAESIAERHCDYPERAAKQIADALAAARADARAEALREAAAECLLYAAGADEDLEAESYGHAVTARVLASRIRALATNQEPADE